MQWPQQRLWNEIVFVFFRFYFSYNVKVWEGELSCNFWIWRGDNRRVPFLLHTHNPQKSGWWEAGSDLPRETDPSRAQMPSRVFLIYSCSEYNCFSPPKHVHVLTPRTCECDLIWKWGLCRYNHVNSRAYGLGGALIQYLVSLLEVGSFNTEDKQGECHVTTEAETWVIRLQAKEHQGLPATTRS